MIDLGLEGKRVVVSGAGRVPGRAGHGTRCAVTLAEAGATVACVDVDEDRGRGTVELIERAGGKAFALGGDMTDARDVDRVIGEAATHLGGLDVCVDIIGKTRWDRAEEMTDEIWDWTLKYNLTQVFYLFRAAARQMIEQGTGGSLISLVSVDGFSAAPFHAAYGAAKAGLVHLIRSCADEWGRHGIRVNGVAPGAVGTGNDDQQDGAWAPDAIHPLAPPRNQDIANGVLFFASNLSARVTGQTLIVDGGANMKGVYRRSGEHLDETNRQNEALGIYDYDR
jgi:NAD(P)-dependent dehydrogenase (short-subunit alcohol dehydrogenase family)